LKRKIFSILFALVLVLALVNPWPASAQDDEFQLAPLNPDFLDFLEQPYEPLYGHIPHSMDLSHLKEIPVQREQALRTLPATFDWRTQGKVTVVKNQNPCGTCWIHGILAAVESRVLIVEDVGYNFSEQNVACCLDPCWVWFHGNRCDRGGTCFMAADVLIKKGTRLEACDPYNTSTINTDTCNDACTNIKRITGFRVVASDPSQITEIKNAIYDYGPVSMAYCHDNSYLFTGNIYYWPDCTATTNHEVCIVGWDDTIAWPGGAGNGAWIVKNSWGTGFGDAGYFYMCYGSANMEDVVSYRYDDYDANETLYYWDEAGKVDAGGYGDTSAWMASVFTSGQDGNLTHVDFWTTSNDASYEIYVYDGSFGSQLASKTGSCAELGYYSIPLTTPVPVTNGQQFTVAVKMTTPGYNFPLPVEYEVTDYYEPPIQTSVSYARHEDGGSWADLAPSYNACLRAKIYSPPTYVTTIHIVGKTSGDAVSQIVFPPGLAEAIVSTPFNDHDGPPNHQILSGTASEPVVRLRNTSARALIVWLSITNWENGVVTSENYELVDTGTNDVNIVDDVLSADGNASSVDTGVAIPAGGYLDLYLEVVLSALEGVGGGSTLTILGEST